MPPLVVGCQSGGQYDQAARELRVQEDQLYAMEDYVNQYQQLLCQVRAENAELRRQLAARGGATRPTPSTRRVTPPATNGPDIDGPEVPPIDGPPAQREIDVPDIPPLGETSLNDRGRRSRTDGEKKGVQLTSAEVEADDGQPGPAVAIHSMNKESAVRGVSVHGEVVVNEEGGGPRLIVNIEPRDAAGQPAKFFGAMSLMIVETTADGGQQKLARWDYRPTDVRAAVDPSTGGESIQYFVEMEPDTQIPEASQLWVQLLPRGGSRIVSHADIDLQQPGAFASLDSEAPTQPGIIADQNVLAAVYNEPSSHVPPVESEILDGGWTVAEPGKPAGLADRVEGPEQWRASSESPPEAVSTAMAQPQPRMSGPSKPLNRSAAVASSGRKPGGWSPERSAGSPRGVATRPTWSATR